MKLTCAREPLFKAVRIAESFLSTRNINKANILIDSSTDMTQIFSTDLDTSVIVKLDTKIQENGAVVVYGKKLSDIISNLPNDDIDLKTTQDHTLKICSLKKEIKAYFSLKGLDKAEYPAIPEINNENFFSISQTELKNLIRKVIYAASNDDTRYVLNGVLFNIHRDKIRMVATDGRRLSMVTREIKGLSDEKNIIVSKKVLTEIEKMLSLEGDCQIGVTEKQVFFHFDNIYIISRLIDGDFPDYDQVIPSSFSLQTTFNRDELLQAVKRISIMVNENYKKLSFTMKDDQIIINASDPEVGDAKEELKIVEKNKEIKEDYIISFNSYFLLDVLKVQDEEQIVFQFNKNTSPALIREKKNSDHVSIIMPMKLV